PHRSAAVGRSWDQYGWGRPVVAEDGKHCVHSDDTAVLREETGRLWKMERMYVYGRTCRLREGPVRIAVHEAYRFAYIPRTSFAYCHAHTHHLRAKRRWTGTVEGSQSSGFENGGCEGSYMITGVIRRCSTAVLVEGGKGK
ncbi:unnamed protein product, partial [Ectocarpus sp. 12 AP-2014]